MNSTLVGGCIVLFTRRDPNVSLRLLPKALPIVAGQYFLLIRARGWLQRATIFYLSMELFLFLMGIMFARNRAVSESLAGSWAAHWEAGAASAIWGQLLCFPALAVIAGANSLFPWRKRASSPSDAPN